MTAKLLQPTLILLTITGGILALYGIFHVFFYLFDSKPLLSGFRYIHWTSLFLGAGLFYVGLVRLK